MSSPVLLPHTWLMTPGGIPLRDPSAGPPPRARPPPANSHPPVFPALSFWDTGLSKPEWPRPRGMRKDRKANYKQPIPVACICSDGIPDNLASRNAVSIFGLRFGKMDFAEYKLSHSEKNHPILTSQPANLAPCPSQDPANPRQSLEPDFNSSISDVPDLIMSIPKWFEIGRSQMLH